MKKEPRYSLTPKGVVVLTVGDEALTDAVMDQLELFARRKGCNAIYFSGGESEFVSIEKEGE